MNLDQSQYLTTSLSKYLTFTLILKVHLSQQSVTYSFLMDFLHIAGRPEGRVRKGN